MNEIPYQDFACPKCGAPGRVNYGVPNYTCMCRMAGMTFMPMPTRDESGCRPVVQLTEADVRRIVRDELGKKVVP